MTRLKPFENVIDVKRVTTVEASRMVRQLHLAASMKVRHGSHKEINDNILGRTTIMYDFSHRIPADTILYVIFLTYKYSLPQSEAKLTFGRNVWLFARMKVYITRASISDSSSFPLAS